MSKYLPTRTTPKTNKAVGLFVAMKREAKKLSLRGAAGLTGIDYAVLNRIEKGKFRMSLPNAITFAERYGFSFAEFKKHAIRDDDGSLI